MTSDIALRVPVQMMRLVLGATFATTFLDNLSHSNYTSRGYRHLIEGYLARGHQPALWRDFMRFAARHGDVLGPAQAFGEATIAILLLTGVAVSLAALTSFALLSSLWLSELGIYWTWEFPPLILIAAALAFSTIPDLSGGIRGLVTSRPTAGGLLDPLRSGGRLALAIVAGVAVAGLELANHQRTTAVWAGGGAAVAVLLCINVLLDRSVTTRARTSNRPAAQNT